MTEFKPIRRVVTGHNSEGRAVIASDDWFRPAMNKRGDGGFAQIWATQTLPADCNDQRDGRDIPAGITLEGGSVLRIVDFVPGMESPMHRTCSIDYGIVLTGKIELELDDGVKTTIEAGGLIIQRGTIHAWRNIGNEVCRVAFILIEATPYLHDGQEFGTYLPD